LGRGKGEGLRAKAALTSILPQKTRRTLTVSSVVVASGWQHAPRIYFKGIRTRIVEARFVAGVALVQQRDAFGEAHHLLADRRSILRIRGKPQIAFEIGARLRKAFQPEVNAGSIADMFHSAGLEDEN
jgi:hypothetical protein